MTNKRLDREAVQVEHSKIQSLEPSEALAAKDNWQQMRASKKVMRLRRDRKRAYG